jgi:PIN domain nuclease of toxin-antitoxin system
LSELAQRGFLLDTHTLIWTLREPEKLSADAENAIAAGELFLSVVSYWEVTIKSMKGRINIGDPRTWWNSALEQLAATTLHLRPDHVSGLTSLPPIHKDPFDRMLIAQASVEGLTLVSRDANVAQYASKTIRIVG